MKITVTNNKDSKEDLLRVLKVLREALAKSTTSFANQTITVTSSQLIRQAIATIILPLWIAAPLPARAEKILLTQARPTQKQILQACANNQMRSLPMPFSDVPVAHWAYDSIMKLYYCGAVRGQIAAAKLERLQNQSSQPGEITVLPEMNTLLSAPETVEIKGRQYVLETYLWRDFMPISPPGGKPLIASIRVIAKDEKAFPTTLKVDHLWVVKDTQQVWETDLNGEAKQITANKLETLARNGPKWMPGTTVDVVIRLIDEDNRSYLLRASQQQIVRTD
ncbi:MAG: hypothetical protein N3E45_11805 [Oscillatoriaceae bacterium SKW80]|nr:hypothetical protein [Oscillatoriaceae bacterium SKYG93]MCX8121487.1 hypothetical protein [Oscillatoriaceae bacterium SKW80]MDW8452927.1 hypothetical protein [Oscillatoriaceae cyanobacterium SKYGB_i_bin93]HIK27832.1 hypothetical protein [Oscillatoriaceae cyanobacterium M7585_C2015_266]